MEAHGEGEGERERERERERFVIPKTNMSSPWE
jgi:hypothetical protein